MFNKIIEKFKELNNNYYFAYFLLLSNRMFSNITFMKHINTILKALGIFLLLIGILLRIKNNTFKKNLILFILSIIFSISFLTSKDPKLLVLFLIIIGAPDINFNEFIKKDMIIRFCLMIFVLIMYYFNFTESFLTHNSNGFFVSSMGFSHPNTFALHIMTLCLDFIYLNFHKMKFLYYIIIAGFIYIINALTGSRTSEIAIIIMIILNIIITKTNINIFKRNWLKYVICVIPILILIASLFLSYNYNGEGIYKDINKIVTNRLRFANWYLDNYDINLFGQKIIKVSTIEAANKKIDRHILDNAYISLLLNYGIIPTITFLMIIFSAINKSYKEKNKAIITLIIIYFLIGFVETYLYLFYANIYLIYLTTHPHNKMKEMILDE